MEVRLRHETMEELEQFLEALKPLYRILNVSKQYADKAPSVFKRTYIEVEEIKD